jgi:hypothetical protein
MRRNRGKKRKRGEFFFVFVFSLSLFSLSLFLFLLTLISLIPLIPAWIAAASLLVTMMAVVPESRIAREVLRGTEKRDRGEVEFAPAAAVAAVAAAGAAAAASAVPAATSAAAGAGADAASTSVPLPPECRIPSSFTVQYPFVTTGAHVSSPSYSAGSTPPRVSFPAGSRAGSLDSHHANTFLSKSPCLTILVKKGTLRMTDRASRPMPTRPSHEVARKSWEASRTIPKGCFGIEIGGEPRVMVSTAEDPVAAPVP